MRFPEIPGIVLEKVIQYLYYKVMHSNVNFIPPYSCSHSRAMQVRYTNSNQRVPNFDIDPELALEVLVAANYLDC